MSEVVRALGVAIRKGQDAGEIGSATSANRATAIKREAEKRGEHEHLDATLVLPSPQDYFAHAQEKTDTYNMTDDVSDAQFEEALADAKFEENMSRAKRARLGPVEAETDTTLRLPEHKIWHSRRKSANLSAT